MAEAQCWIPHDDHGFVKAQLLNELEDGKIRLKSLEDNKVLVLDKEELLPMNPESQDGVQDNTQLMHLHAASLLHNVRHRHLVDKIYTYTGYILIAMNPYKSMAAQYDTDTIFRYSGKSMGVLPPHVFAVADRAYRMMKADGSNQSILISGESGAGKTETSKFCMNFLANVGAAHGVGQLEERIIECNPILEAFGNAKTLRNNNSSRFGKFTEIHFDKDAKVAGASVVTYLLEKSRLVHQATGERNYHIFYQLCAGASDDMRAHLGVGQAGEYRLLTGGDCTVVDDVDDARHFAHVLDAMDKIGMSPDEKTHIWEILAALLLLGNVEYEGDEEASIVDAAPLAKAAELLGVNQFALKQRLTSRTMKSMSRRRSEYAIPLKREEAEGARDAFCKAVYNKLFLHVVERINESLRDEHEPASFIGVLDIYGFEYFESNSFEQLCINYANECLQQHFNDQVFRQEQEIYEREGVKAPHVDYEDNTDVIDLIAKKPSGIMHILEEQCRMPKADDKSFANKIHNTHTRHARLSAPRMSRRRGGGGSKPGTPVKKALTRDEAFIVSHFAGKVTYEVEGFLAKNNDSLHDDLRLVCVGSQHALLPKLFHGSTGSRSKFSSVGGKFIKQLADLMKRLRETQSHFIRCVKPNAAQKPNLVDGASVMSQLRCGGMIECLRLMHTGYPTRCPYDDLYDRYKPLMPPVIAELDITSFCEALLMALELKPEDYALGITRVFFRAGKLAFLDELTNSDESEIGPQIAERVKRWLCRKRFRRAVHAVRTINMLGKMVKDIRAFNRFHSAAYKITLINKHWLRLARTIKKRRAATRIQAHVRGMWERRTYQRQRAGIVVVQTYVRRWLCQVKFAPVLAEARARRAEERKREAEAERAQRRAEEKARTQAMIDAAARRDEERRNREAARKAEAEEAKRAEKEAAEAAARRDRERDEEAERRAREKEAEHQRQLEEQRRQMEEMQAMMKKMQEDALAAAQAQAQVPVPVQVQASSTVPPVAGASVPPAAGAGVPPAATAQVAAAEGTAPVAAPQRVVVAAAAFGSEEEWAALQDKVTALEARVEEETKARKLLEGAVSQLQSQIIQLLGTSVRRQTMSPGAMHTPQRPAVHAHTPQGHAYTPPVVRGASPSVAAPSPAGSGGSGGGGLTAPLLAKHTPASRDTIAAVQKKATSASANSWMQKLFAPSPSAGGGGGGGAGGVTALDKEQVDQRIRQLRAQVDVLQAHFATATDETRDTIGSDVRQKKMATTVRHMGAELLKVLNVGFKSFKLIGRYHVWDALERLQENYSFAMGGGEGVRARFVHGVTAVNNIPMMRNKDMKFRALVCYFLNQHALHEFIAMLVVDEMPSSVQKMFERFSPLAMEDKRTELVALFEEIDGHPWMLNLDYELTSWDM